MKQLLKLADGIDGINMSVASVARCALLANALVITFNAIARKLFSVTYSSAFDLQWHFFAAVVLLMAAYTLQRNEHVRIDIFANQLGSRGLAWLDLLGTLFVLIPVCGLMAWFGSVEFLNALSGHETRSTRESTSEIPAWIMKGFIPLGFILLGLQGVSEAIRCLAHITGIEERDPNRSLLSKGTVNE